MKVAIIGTGYVGLPTGIGLAELGHDVVCIDRDQSKIDKLAAGEITLFEEGLDKLFKKNKQAGRIQFAASMKGVINSADLVIIAVGTPLHPITQKADLKYIHAAATELAEHLEGYTVIATKSTVPVGTGDDIEILIQMKNPHAQFDVVSLPEFLREGFAVYDFFHPDRIIVGANSKKAFDLIDTLYTYFQNKTTIIHVSRRSAEMIKYAANSFLAMKIHYINELANFCEKADVNIKEVAKGIGMDTRIGSKFLNPGPGYGGSCFPKDTAAMAFMAKQNNVELSLINATIKGNANRKKEMAERILLTVKRIENPKIAILGLAFKKGTDDCRESPAIDIILELLEQKANITAYDPKAMVNAQNILDDKIQYADTMYDAVQNADVVAILTEWEEFQSLDFAKLSSLMRNKNIVDCRNILNPNKAKKFGFMYQGIGYKAF